MSDSPSSGSAEKTPHKRRRLRGLVIWLAAVVVLAGGSVVAWQSGGFEVVSARIIDVAPGEALVVNDFEFSFSAAQFAKQADGSVRVEITATCRNTAATSPEFIAGWFAAASMVVGAGIDGGPNQVAPDSATSLSITLSPYDAATFNPTAEPLPCLIAAEFRNGLGPSDRVTVIMRPVRLVENLFKHIEVNSWEPTTYYWYRVRVPLTEKGR